MAPSTIGMSIREIPLTSGLSTGVDLSSLSTDLLEAWEWENSYTGDHAGTVSAVQNGPPAFVDSANGKGIRVQNTGGAHQVRIHDPTDNVFNPGTKDMAVACFVKYRTEIGFGNTQGIWEHKGSAGGADGLKVYYRGDLQSVRAEIANGTTRITIAQPNGNALDETNGNYIAVNWDRSGDCDIYVDKTKVGFGDISSQETDDIVPNNLFIWGNGDFIIDSSWIWDRILTTDEIDLLHDENVTYSDL